MCNRAIEKTQWAGRGVREQNLDEPNRSSKRSKKNWCKIFFYEAVKYDHKSAVESINWTYYQLFETCVSLMWEFLCGSNTQYNHFRKNNSRYIVLSSLRNAKVNNKSILRNWRWAVVKGIATLRGADEYWAEALVCLYGEGSSAKSLIVVKWLTRGPDTWYSN